MQVPTLRATRGGDVVELRSAKSLLGASAATCDIVLPSTPGVLELHALLNLSDDKCSATLVPFAATPSTTSGACFLNGALVPPDGALVVHGDRLAFGDRNNEFVFGITAAAAPRPPASIDARLSQSFRHSVNALRGDQRPVATAASLSRRDPRKVSVSSSVGSQAGSRSSNRLERFLQEASSDSLLSEYVERKLRQSAVSTRNRPRAMEPPPSLSASSVSSTPSVDLHDSILNRSVDQADQRERSSTTLSTAERNYAEIEKLRLSQRLREVNNVRWLRDLHPTWNLDRM
ncbi:hypothetical protein PINS_up013524 [Pythium insidiosum]|nr:hypothetical protein PINS_up013524 [Pythium insidiosum]